jgi:hypothetical protein
MSFQLKNVILCVVCALFIKHGFYAAKTMFMHGLSSVLTNVFLRRKNNISCVFCVLLK